MFQQKPRHAIAIDEDASTVMLRKRKRKRSRPVAIGANTPFSLVVVEGRHRGSILRLRTGENTVGRSLDAAISLTDNGISRQHAKFIVDRSYKVMLLDANSTNGTTVNNKRVDSTTIRVGDRIRLGTDVVLELRFDPEEKFRVHRPTRAVEPDAPVPRGRRPQAQDASFRSKVRALELGSTSTKACWGYSGAALISYDRLLKLREAKLGGKHVAVAEILEMMGRALQNDAQYQRACVCFRRAEEIYANQSPPLDAQIAYAAVRRAQCDLALQRKDEALSSFERAEQLLERIDDTTYELACVRLAIGQTLWSMNRDLPRARELARKAQIVFVRGGPSMQSFRHDADLCIKVIDTSAAQAKSKGADAVTVITA